MGTVCIAMLAQGIYRQMAQHEPITAVLKALHMPEIGCVSGLFLAFTSVTWCIVGFVHACHLLLCLW